MKNDNRKTEIDRTLKRNLKRLKKEGKSEDYISSYLRKWEEVGRASEKSG